jgi:glutamine synthetase
MAKTATASATDIIETWRADGIRYVRFELPDMHGTSRSKIVPIDQASGYCEEGLNMYGGAAVLDSRSDVVPNTLYHEEIGYGDQRLIPDPETAAVVPWAEATARFICDSQFIGGEPLRATPRHVFRRQLERCHDLGYEPVLGFEPEFYLLHQDGSLVAASVPSEETLMGPISDPPPGTVPDVLGLSVHVLPRLHDVDTEDDWHRLKSRLPS